MWRFFAVGLLVVLAVVTALTNGSTYHPHTRTYYIAAEDGEWNYAPGGHDLASHGPVPQPYSDQLVYSKTRYIEYTDASFTAKKPQAEWLGILGPIIRGVPGDTIKVVFKNRAAKPYSIHPHGVEYTKENEGAMMMDGDDGAGGPLDAATMQQAMRDSAGAAGGMVAPGGSFTYTWHVRPDAGPQPGQGSSRVWLYHSHVTPDDIYDGVIGPIIITSPQHARADGSPDDVDHEFVALFMIFDESKPGMTDDEHEGAQKHAMNGRIFSNLTGFIMNQGDRVRWHLLDLGNEPDVHTPHWHGNVVKTETGLTTDVVELLPASMRSVDMIPDAAGLWMFHCHVADHMEAGMMTQYLVLHGH
ncbi:MAG TPA: multicopper oxidase domain-containing protein [Candidatus Saccharimonadia bacterium]|nr:multicopper oxidase domain-containing protein [Candidatus Saccharimonadia bacterium]